MKQNVSTLLILIGILHLATSAATEFELKIIHSQLSVKINDIPYSKEILAQELKSGLPNQLRIELKLSDKNTVLTSHTISYEITYDLWDENYRLNLVGDKNAAFLLKDDKQLKNYISKFTQGIIIDLKNISKTKFLKLSFRVFLNPVKNEKIEKIRNWMRESNGYEKITKNNEYNPLIVSPILRNPPSENNTKSRIHSTSRVSSSGPRFQKLFDKILEKNMDEDTIAAQWESPVFFEMFTIESLAIENH